MCCFGFSAVPFIPDTQLGHLHRTHFRVNFGSSCAVNIGEFTMGNAARDGEQYEGISSLDLREEPDASCSGRVAGSRVVISSKVILFLSVNAQCGSKDVVLAVDGITEIMKSSSSGFKLNGACTLTVCVSEESWCTTEGISEFDASISC